MLVESVGDGKSALWLDGFLPSREWLKENYARISRHLPEHKLEQDLRRNSNDQLFLKGMEAAAYQVRDRNYPGQLFWDNIYYLRAGFANQFGWLSRELIREPRERYRQIILIYDTEPFAGRTDDFTMLVNRSGFTPKSDDQYRSYARFEKGVLEVLATALEPFLVPCAVAEGHLRGLGFWPKRITL